MLSRLARFKPLKHSAFRYFSSDLITDLKGREVLDSRGNPTVEVDLHTQHGIFRSIVPSGASTGTHEAHELRDGEDRYNGKGVRWAARHVSHELKEKLLGQPVTDLYALDTLMKTIDGTDNKSVMGANAILGVSLSAAKAGAAAKNVPLYQHFADLAGNPESTFTLPVPCFNVLNGGEHAGNALAFQEFFVIPSGAETFAESLQIGAEIFHKLKSIIKQKYGGDATLIGDEGGFAPPINADEGLELLMQSLKDLGYEDKVKLGLDVASSEFKVSDKDQYDLDFKSSSPDPSQLLSGDELREYYAKLCAKYPIVTIEDPFDQDDWSNWVKITDQLGEDVQIVGDDLTVTNPVRIQQAVDQKACNALLLKVNQIGSVSESIDAVKLAKQNGWGVMTSHRSGETEDATIADLAVGLCTGEIKAGAPCRGERTAKYNQLLRIEEELGSRAVFAGNAFRTPSWMG